MMVMVVMMVVMRPQNDARYYPYIAVVVVMMMVMVMVILRQLDRLLDDAIGAALGEPGIIGFHQCKRIRNGIEQVAIAHHGIRRGGCCSDLGCAPPIVVAQRAAPKRPINFLSMLFILSPKAVTVGPHCVIIP